MAIEVKCNSCDHRWSVPSAKAGRSTYCPDCDEEVSIPSARPERKTDTSIDRKPMRRPQASDRQISSVVILCGSMCVLGGVLGLLAWRLYGVSSDENLVLDLTPVTELAESVTGNGPPAGPRSGEPPGDRPDSQPNAAPNPDAAPDPDGGRAGNGSSNSVETERGRRMALAKLKTVAVSVTPLALDQRRAVFKSVDETVRSEVERCGLASRSREDTADAELQVEMDVRKSEKTSHLWVIAQLDTGESGAAGMLWQHSADMGVISQNALRSGIVPTNLRRDVADMFTDLRERLLECRREFTRALPGRVRTIEQ